MQIESEILPKPCATNDGVLECCYIPRSLIFDDFGERSEIRLCAKASLFGLRQTF
jgi:hypothetical protein